MFFYQTAKGKQAAFENEMTGLKWDDVLSSDDLQCGCRINSVRERFTA